MPSSPKNAETSEGPNDEGFFDVWLIKGIRVFWNPKTKKRQKKYLVSWLGYPWWDDTWEPRENIGEGCDDLVTEVERAAALGPEPAVGTEWLAPKDWLEMEANRRLQKPSDPGFQARINEARKREEDDKKRGDPMAIAKGSTIRAAAKQNLLEYQNYMAERNPRKRQPPTSSVKNNNPIGILPINKEYQRWFRKTRRSTRDQGYFHYSGDDQELAEMTSFTIQDDFHANPKAIRRFVSSGKAPIPQKSTGSNKKRRRSAEPSSGENDGSPSELFIEASDDDIPLRQLSKRKPWVPISRPNKKKGLHVEGPLKKKQRIDPQPKHPTPPPDSESSDAEVALIKQKRLQFIESSSDEDEPLSIQARKNKPQVVLTARPTQVSPLNILNQPAPAPKSNPKATITPNLAPSRSVTLPSTSGSRAQAKRSATGPSAIPPSTVGGSNATQNNPPLSSYLRLHNGGSIVKGGVPYIPVNRAVNRKQYVGTSSKQQGLSLGSRARMLGEAPAVGPNRQADRPSNTTTVTTPPEPDPTPPRSGVAAFASQPLESIENNEDDDLFGDNELEGTEQLTDNLDVEMDLNIDLSEPMMVESPAAPPKQSGPAPIVASKAAQLEVEATGFLTGILAEVAPTQAAPRSEPPKGPRRIGLYLGSPGSKRLCEVYLANVSNPSLASAHLNKWIFIPGENHSIYLDKLHSASHAPLILPAFEPLQWARLDPWDHEADTRSLEALSDWLSEANQFAILEVPNRPAWNFCIFSPRCKPFFDVFPNANLNYREVQSVVLVLLKRRFSPSHNVLPRKPSPTPELLIKLPREVLYQDPSISRGLMLLKLPQSTFEAWQTACQSGGKPRSFSLFTMETILYRKVKWYGDQLPAHEHAAWRLKHQPETKALLRILEIARLKPWHLMERTDITFLHNNSWEFLKKLPGLHDRLGRAHIQFFAFGPHHSLSSDKWGVREVFKRGAVVTFTARLIAENGEIFKTLVEKIHKSPVSVAYVTPLTVALVELMVTDVQLYPSNLQSLQFLLDAILDSQISLMTAPPYSWKHDDMNKWRETQFTFGAEECRFQEPIEALAFSFDKGTATPPLQYRSYDSILNACAKELETFQQEPPVARGNEVDTGFRQLGRHPPYSSTTATNERISKTALQLEADVNTTLYSDLRLMQTNHFYQTEYRHFVVIESKDSTARTKDKVVDSIAHLTADEALRLIDPVTQNRTNIV